MIDVYPLRPFYPKRRKGTKKMFFSLFPSRFLFHPLSLKKVNGRISKMGDYKMFLLNE